MTLQLPNPNVKGADGLETLLSHAHSVGASGNQSGGQSVPHTHTGTTAGAGSHLHRASNNGAIIAQQQTGDNIYYLWKASRLVLLRSLWR